MLVPALKCLHAVGEPMQSLAVHLSTFQPNLVMLTIFTVSILYCWLFFFFLISCVYYMLYIYKSILLFIYQRNRALLGLNEYIYDNSRNSGDSRDIGESKDKQNVGQQEQAQSQHMR